jgi:hypothetical protein
MTNKEVIDINRAECDECGCAGVECYNASGRVAAIDEIGAERVAYLPEAETMLLVDDRGDLLCDECGN